MKKFDIAYVGYVGNNHDMTMKLRVLDFLFDKEGSNIDFNEDIVDLNSGRDFLLEDKVYDIIVICYICKFDLKTERNLFDEFKSSKNHTWHNWFKKLELSNAKYIFTFGGDTEVTAKFVGPLCNYSINESINSCLTYIKN